MIRDTPNGDLAYRMGLGLPLFHLSQPHPRQALRQRKRALTTEWHGRTITLPANNIGTKPDAEHVTPCTT